MQQEKEGKGGKEKEKILQNSPDDQYVYQRVQRDTTLWGKFWLGWGGCGGCLGGGGVWRVIRVRGVMLLGRMLFLHHLLKIAQNVLCPRLSDMRSEERAGKDEKRITEHIPPSHCLIHTNQ